MFFLSGKVPCLYLVIKLWIRNVVHFDYNVFDAWFWYPGMIEGLMWRFFSTINRGYCFIPPFFFCLLLIKTLYVVQRSVIHVVVVDHFAKDSWRDKDYQNRQLKTKSIVAKFTFLTGLFVFKSLCQYLCYQSCPTDLFCDITWKYWITKVLIILFVKNSSLGLASSPWFCLPVHRSAEINGWRKMLLICTSKICFYQRYYVEAS